MENVLLNDEMVNFVENENNLKNTSNDEKTEYIRISVNNQVFSKINILKSYFSDCGNNDKEKINFLLNEALNLLYKDKKADLDKLFA